MLIDFKNANIYQDDKLILKDVNLQVQEGEFIYIIGRVGSGKSSLLKTIYNELDIDEEDAEKAEVLGRDVRSIKRNQIPAQRRQMGIIFQDFQLLHDRSVYENLRFVLRATEWTNKERIDRRIGEVLAEVGMSDKTAKMPSELSGGEQQRIAIARAILNRPKLLIADEPTGNLDPETASIIVELLQKTSKEGTAVLMSTHNINMIEQYPGKVYRCKQGQFSMIANVDSSDSLLEEAEEMSVDKAEVEE